MRLRYAFLVIVAALAVGCGDKANDLTGTHGVQAGPPTHAVPPRPATPTPAPGGDGTGAPCHPMPKCQQDL